MEREIGVPARTIIFDSSDRIGIYHDHSVKLLLLATKVDSKHIYFYGERDYKRSRRENNSVIPFSLTILITILIFLILY